MALSLERVAKKARLAASRLREGLIDILHDDLVAIWLYGGQLAEGGSPGDVDLHVVVRREPDDRELAAIRNLHESIRRDLKIDELDAWYVLLSEARSLEGPRDLNWHEEIRDENWALKRAHWLADAYVLVHGVSPAEVVLRPEWPQIEAELFAQVANAAKEVAGDCPDPAVLTMRLCRVLLTVATREVVHTKIDAARWALNKLSPESQAHVAAALRVYNGMPLPGDADLLRARVGAFYQELHQMIDHLMPHHGSRPR